MRDPTTTEAIKYFHVKLLGMVRALSGHGDQRTRLDTAYHDFRSSVTPGVWPSRLPKDLQSEVRAISETYGQLRANRLDEAGVSELAERIITLYAKASYLDGASLPAA